jgi:hypothetical protein
MSLAEKVDPKTDAVSLYHTIFELEAALNSLITPILRP